MPGRRARLASLGAAGTLVLLSVQPTGRRRTHLLTTMRLNLVLQATRADGTATAPTLPTSAAAG
ncbi:hypothetical protein [Actinokineospora sp. NPDC004072]